MARKTEKDTGYSFETKIMLNYIYLWFIKKYPTTTQLSTNVCNRKKTEFFFFIVPLKKTIKMAKEKKENSMPSKKSNIVYENWKVYSMRHKLMFRCNE